MRTHANTFAVYLNQQGLQRRATPHPSELKVMKNVIEARRNEAYTARPDEDLESPDTEVSECSFCKLASLEINPQNHFNPAEEDSIKT